MWTQVQKAAAVVTLAAVLVCVPVGARTLQQAGGILSGLNADINAIIYNDLRAGSNLNEVRNDIFVNMAQNKALQIVKNLRAEVSTIISNAIISSDSNDVENLIAVLLANNIQFDANVSAAITAYGITNITGDTNTVDQTQWYELLSSIEGQEFLGEIYANITGTAFTNINGTDNSVGNDVVIEAVVGEEDLGSTGGYTRPDVIGKGKSPVNITNFDLLINAVLINEVQQGNGNYLDNFLNIAVANGIDIANVSATIEATLVNQIRGSANDMTNLVNIGLGLCSGRVACSVKDFSIDVSTVLLNDITGDNNVVNNMVDINGLVNSKFAGSSIAKDAAEAAKSAYADIEAVIVNTILPGEGLLDEVKSLNNKINNQIAVDFLKGTVADVEDIKLKVSAIIANELKGSDNYLDNLITLGIANGKLGKGKMGN